MKVRRHRLVIHAATMALALGGAIWCRDLAAQVTELPGLSSRGNAVGHVSAWPEPDYGTSTESSYYAGAADFKGAVADTYVIQDGTGSAIFYGTGNQYAWAPVHVPQGALITGIDFDYYDTDGTWDVEGILYEFPNTGGFTTLASAVSFGSGGFGRASQNLVAPWLVDNSFHSYAAFVQTFGPSSTQKWRGLRVRYRLQVSPAPGVATFPNDVPTSHPFFKYVEALAAAGITGGCGAGSYCPDSPVTRGQMAVFLSVALGLHWPN